MKFIGSRLLPLIVAGLAIQLSLSLLVRQENTAAAAEKTILVLLVSSIFYLIACRAVLANHSTDRATLVIAALFAVSFRLTLAPAEPSLSDDLYRYRWEGRVQLAGALPYSAQPDEPRWQSLRDATYPRISGKDIRFGYGPLWVLMERAVASTGAGILWWKFPAALCDLLSVAALAWLLTLHGLPAGRIVIYAWCPLVIVEFWHSGHNDSALLLFLILALAFAKRGWWAAGYAALTLAAMVKFWPALLLPLWWSRSPNWKSAVAVPVTAFPFALWVWTPLRERADFITGFLGGWRNNDSLFGLILWASAGDARRAKFVSLALLAITSIVLAVWRRWPLERATLAFVACMLLFSANVHPWYITWMLPMAALLPSLPVLLAACLAPILYAVLIDYRTLGVWNGSTPWRWWLYLPVLGCTFGELIRRFRRRMI
ncbi:MAG: hypothetical protein HY858_08145 [Candidatus Solibacter usitatus]|nr:hypothetical protein [Candidatus Solibacter usitatus]